MVLEEGWQISLALQHPDDLHVGLTDPVEDHVAAVREASEPFSQLVSFPTHVRIPGEGLTSLRQGINQAVGRAWLVRGHVQPDLFKVAYGGRGKAGLKAHGFGS